MLPCFHCLAVLSLNSLLRKFREGAGVWLAHSVTSRFPFLSQVSVESVSTSVHGGPLFSKAYFQH